MTDETTDKIAVVAETDALHTAYHDGYDRFENADDIPRDPEDCYAVEGCKEGANWANNVAPSLRATAGLADSGHGTYQVDRTAAVIPIGDEDDQPAEAVLVPAREVYSQLVEAWDIGATDALLGHDRGECIEDTYIL